MSDANVFGPVIDSSDVEKRLLEHLEAWMPTMVAFVRRTKDPSKTRWKKGVSPIRSFTVKHAVAEKWPEDQLPMLLAQSPGMEDDPVQDGSGMLSATYAVLLVAIASGVTQADAKALARLYSSAASFAIMTDPSLKAGSAEASDEFAAGVRMGQAVNYPVTRGLDPDRERSLMAVSTPYYIEIEDILDVTGGPTVPLIDPDEEPGDWPTVKEGGGSVQVGRSEADFS